MAVTGQSTFPVTPTTTSEPVPNWSHFDLLRWIYTIRGAVELSTAMSPQARWVVTLKAAIDSGRSSPRQKNPKKATQATAHRTVLFGLSEAT